MNNKDYKKDAIIKHFTCAGVFVKNSQIFMIKHFRPISSFEADKSPKMVRKMSKTEFFGKSPSKAKWFIIVSPRYE